MKFQRRLRGFTLIELMVTVAVVSILAAIAIPSYGNYVRRGKVVEATSALADMRMKMEQYYQDNRTYQNYVDASCKLVSNGNAIIDARYFTYSCGSDTTTYTITATGVAAKGMGGYSYTINQNNAKTSAVPGATGATCWITKSGETC
jgi:type IV pilus assembly protein PilE